MRASGFAKVSEVINRSELHGSSPPSLFVGRYGYPKVYVGPLVPPKVGDTSVMASPESWYDMTMMEFVEMMSSLVRGMYRVRVDKIEEAGRFVDGMHDLVLSSSSAYTEALFSKPVRGSVTFVPDVQPFGPSGQLSGFAVAPAGTNLRIEGAFENGDLKAADAVWDLYASGERVQSIQRALSAGMLGLEKKRRLVPTRWSITAVDDILAKRMISAITSFPELAEYRLYCSRSMGNNYVVLLIPGKWSFELIEVFHRGSVWNTWGDELAIGGDFEGLEGRKTYAMIGGCYYAGRLAVLEHLRSERRLATAIVIREALPAYMLPVGVWTVRQGVRDALSRSPVKFGTLKDAISELSEILGASIDPVVGASKIIRHLTTRRKITEYL